MTCMPWAAWHHINTHHKEAGNGELPTKLDRVRQTLLIPRKQSPCPLPAEGWQGGCPRFFCRFLEPGSNQQGLARCCPREGHPLAEFGPVKPLVLDDTHPLRLVDVSGTRRNEKGRGCCSQN